MERNTDPRQTQAAGRFSQVCRMVEGNRKLGTAGIWSLILLGASACTATRQPIATDGVSPDAVPSARITNGGDVRATGRSGLAFAGESAAGQPTDSIDADATQFGTGLEWAKQNPQREYRDAYRDEYEEDDYQDDYDRSYDDPYGSHALFDESHGQFMQDWQGFRPEITGSYFFRPDTEIQSEPGTFDENAFSLDAHYQLPVAPDTWIEGGARYRARVLEFSSNFQGADEDETLHELALEVRFGQFINDDLLVVASFSPGIYSDIEQTLNSRDYQFFGSGIGVYRMSPDLYLQGGLFVNQDFEDLPVYVGGGVVWLFAPRWRLDVFAPRHARLQWNPTDRLFLEGFLTLEGREYSRRATARFGTQRQLIQTQDVRAGVSGTWRFTDMFSANASFGSTLFGDYDFQGPTGQSNGQLQSELFFTLGFGVNF